MSEYIDTSEIYCIYGMSIGETDKSWWIKIAENLLTKKNKRLIIFGFENNADFGLASKKIDAINKWKTRFVEQSDNIAKRLELVDMIHIAINADIFDIKIKGR
jgi:hypothetical protein